MAIGLADYQLLDFGQGRKLERWGAAVVDRPAPSAEGLPLSDPARWSAATHRFHRRTAQSGEWSIATEGPELAPLAIASLRFELRLTDSGQLGLFPEQLATWNWLDKFLAAGARPAEVLNLFAYTGASSLVAARAGARVAHVDASSSAVAWARRNAELSDLAQTPIRWLVDDARAFVRRELRRGRRYDLVILDPPSYGHGPRGQAWNLERDLPGLLTDCAGLLAAQEPSALMLTCHTPGFAADRLGEVVRANCPILEVVAAGDLELSTPEGRDLPSGSFLRAVGHGAAST